MLSTNLRSKSDGPFPIAGVLHSVTLEVAGVRVGIVGAITEGALTRTHPSNTEALTIAPLAVSVRDEARKLRAQGARLVIATVHAGGECARFDDPNDLASCDPDSELFALANAMNPADVDLIVGGHTHKGIAHRVHGIPVVEAFSEGRAFARVDLQVDRAVGVVGQRIFPPTALCAERLDAAPCTTASYEGEPVERASNVIDALARFMAQAEGERRRRLGVEIVDPLNRDHDAETALGNLIVDLMREAVPAARVAINNGGSIRTSVAAGPLDYGELFEVFPFDNVLATVELRASELTALIADNLQNDRGFLSLSGIRARARCRGDRLEVQLQHLDGTTVPSDAKLLVVTSDFLARGGDGLMRDVSPERISLRDGQLMRDALVDGLTRRGRVRGSDRALFDPTRPRIQFEGTRPIHCTASR
jgi:5'-nucleotidase